MCDGGGSGELRCEIPIIISNHPDLEGVAASFGVPFQCLPLAKGSGPEGKAAQVGGVPEPFTAGPLADQCIMERHLLLDSPIRTSLSNTTTPSA